MVRLGWIEQAEAEQADQEALCSNRATRPRSPLPVLHRRGQAAAPRRPRLGKPPPTLQPLFRGGLRIYTTVDPLVQESAELAVASVIEDEAPYALCPSSTPGRATCWPWSAAATSTTSNDPVARFNLATQGAPAARVVLQAVRAGRRPRSGLDPRRHLCGWQPRPSCPSTVPGRSTTTTSHVPGPHPAGGHGVFGQHGVCRLDRIGPQPVVDVATAPGSHPPRTVPLAGARRPGGLAAGHGLCLRHLCRRRHPRRTYSHHPDRDADGNNVYEAVPAVTEASAAVAAV